MICFKHSRLPPVLKNQIKSEKNKKWKETEVVETIPKRNY